MGTIIAIGGGEIGRPNENGGFYPVETTPIDRRIHALTNKRHPTLLFMPTASDDSHGYCRIVDEHFTKLGFCVDHLLLSHDLLTIRDRILSADAIYVGGGNTLKMMKRWRRYGVDTILAQAYNKGIILSGLSAGMICWFTYGISDSRKFTSDSDTPMRVSGLGLIDAVGCPHYNAEAERPEALRAIMARTSRLVGIGLDNCCSIEVIDDHYRILTSEPTACAYKAYWSKGVYRCDTLPSDGQQRTLASLYARAD